MPDLTDSIPTCLQNKNPFFKAFPFKNILRLIKKDHITYLKKFKEVLVTHLEQEFEVTIADGRLTDLGLQTLSKLESDFSVLQYEEAIEKNVSSKLSKINHNNYLVKNLLYVVKDDLVSQTELFAKKIQMKILKRRRMKLNVFCNTKCHNNKIIMNFTDVEAGVDFLAFLPINIGERYKKIFDLRKVISQSEIPFDLKQLHQLSVGL